MFGNNKEEANTAYSAGGDTSFGRMLAMVNTDKVWAEPARFTARAFAAKGAPAYIYLFSYVSPTMQQMMRYGAGHASEIQYVFNNIRGRNGTAVPAKDSAVANLMNTYWTNFAKTGNPNGGGLPAWPVYSAATGELIEFKADGTAAGEADPKKARLDVMEKTYKQQ